MKQSGEASKTGVLDLCTSFWSLAIKQNCCTIIFVISSLWKIKPFSRVREGYCFLETYYLMVISMINCSIRHVVSLINVIQLIICITFNNFEESKFK